MMTRVIPILRIFDEAKAREFYVDWLGFAVDWEHRFEDNAPLYLQISRDDILLHLSEHHGDASPGAKLLVECPGIEEYHRELIVKKYKYNRPGLETQFWGARSVMVNDPFGNRLEFFERIEE